MTVKTEKIHILNTGICGSCGMGIDFALIQKIPFAKIKDFIESLLKQGL